MFPIIKESHLPEENKKGNCVMCKKKLPTDNYWIMLGGGLSIHRHFHDGTGVFLDVVDNDVGQQADIGFCSKECTQEFFRKIADNIK